jgi:hypothetical protein
MNRIIQTIRLLMELLRLWRPQPRKETPRAKNDPPVGTDRPDDLIDRL